MALWLLNKPTRRKRNMVNRKRRRRMTAKQRMYFGKRRRRRNPIGLIYNKKRRRSTRRRRRNSFAMVPFNPRRRKARARRGGFRRRAGGFLRGAFGGLGKLLTIGFAFQVLGAGLGALLSVVLPNALLGTQAWYRDNPWTRIAVRAGFAALLLPMLTGLLPGAMGAALLVGGLASVGISIIGTILNRPLNIGTGDTGLSFQSFGFSGNPFGAYAPTHDVLGPGNPFGAYAPTRSVLPFAGSPSGGGPRV